jgi:hypothetical protein
MSMRRIAFVVGLLSLSSMAWADGLWNGTWVLREAEPGGQLTMILEEMSTGWNVTYKVVGPGAAGASDTHIMTSLDGKDVPVLIDGEPSGQTMGVTKIDSHHTVNVIKSKGKEIGVSKAELSTNGKVIKVETDYSDSNPGAPAGKQIQYWDRH